LLVSSVGGVNMKIKRPDAPNLTSLSSSDMHTGSWAEWGTHILFEIERLGEDIKDLRDERKELRIEIKEVRAELEQSKINVAVLKEKSTLFGAIGGVLGTIAALGIAIAIWIIKNSASK